MPKYIDADALLQNSEILEAEVDSGVEPVMVYCISRNAVRDAPAADVVEVRHGYWREDTDPADGDLRCTRCGAAWPRCVQKEIAKQGVWTLQTLFRYCPRCGAKMDAKKEDICAQ